MGPAGILIGAPKDEDRSGSWELKAIVDEARLQALQKAHPGRVTAGFRHVPESFARMLAKIGYCQVLSSLDVDDFTPLCLPYIVRREKNLSYLVGARASIDAPQPGIGYSLNSLQFGTQDRRLLLAEIRLFADNHTPTYHVVVGEVSGAERVRKVDEKLKAYCTALIPDGFVVPESSPDELYWTPRIWPLPHWASADMDR